MKKFMRQTSGGATTANINLDLGAASAKVGQVREPGDYRLRIEAARVLSRQNISVALDLVEVEGGGRVANRPLWVDGPNAGNGHLAAENQHLLAQLLALAGLPTAGNLDELIPKLAGLEFDASIVLSVDHSTGRKYNSLATIYADGAP